jgi:NADH:ubiquinone oxidoreductase subunit 3 (subunit A)
MAYPTVSAPYGFQAINRVDGMPYAGAIRQIPITSAYGTAIYNGDIVKLVVGGVVEKSAIGDNVTAQPSLGVFVGCQYVNSSGQTVQAQYYPTGVTSAIAFVVLDPQAAFKAAVTTSGNTSVVTSVTRAVVGTNMAIATGTGNNATGNSGLSVISGSAANTAILPVRVIDVVPETAVNATNFREVIVKLNQPQLEVTLGNNLS